MAFPIIDILIILVLVVFLLIGLIKGFWRSLIALCSSLVTLIIAILLSKPLSMLLDSWFHLNSSFAGAFQPGIESYINQHGYASGWMRQVLNIIMGNDYMSSVTDQTTLVNDFSLKLGQVANALICVVVLYIIIKIALFFLSKLLNKLTDNPLMQGVDKTFGAIFGLLKGTFVVFVALGIMFGISSLITPIGDWISGVMSSNPFTNVLYGWTQHLIQNILVPFVVG